MKLKSIHVRSPKDDQDLSCFLIKNTDIDPEHAHEPIDCLIMNPSDEQNHLQNSDKLSEDIFQATNELGSLLSKINTTEPQVLIVNTPPRGANREDSIHLEPELAFIQGNILLFNQNTKAKVAEKNVLNMFARKYFSIWHQLFKSTRWNRLRLKKNMMKVWRRVVDDIEIPSDSTETFVDSMQPTEKLHTKPVHPPSDSQHGNNPKVLIVDIESEDLSSFPQSFFHPNTQSFPLSPETQPKPQGPKTGRTTTPIMNIKPKTPINRQKQMPKHYLLPTQASQPHPLPQEPVYHITRSSPTNNSPAQEDKTQVSSLSKGSSSHYLHPQLSLKYPNYHLINNYMKLYEQEEHQRQNEVPKPKKLFKSSTNKTPDKSGRRKVSTNVQHKNVSGRPDQFQQQQEHEQSIRSRDPSAPSASSPHPLKQFKNIGFQNLHPQHLQFQLPEKTQRQQELSHPLYEGRGNSRDEQDGEDGDGVSVVSSLSSTSNTRRYLLQQRGEKSNLSKERLSRLNQQLREEKEIPVQQAHPPAQQTAAPINPQKPVVPVQQRTLAPAPLLQQQRSALPLAQTSLQLEISPIKPEEIHNLSTTTNLAGNQYTPSTATNNPASLSSLMFKNRNQFAHLLDNGRDNASLCNIDSSSSLPNQIDYLSIDERNNEESDNSSSLPTFGKKLKQKMQKYHSNPAVVSSVPESTLPSPNMNKPSDSSNRPRRESVTSQQLPQQAVILPASLPERKQSFRGSIILTASATTAPTAVPIPVIPLGSPGEETVSTKENSPTHSNKLLPAPQANPLQSRLALIKQKIVQTSTKPSAASPLREKSSPAVEEGAVQITANHNNARFDSSPILLTERRKQQLMRRFFSHSKESLQQNSFYWQLFEQSAYFHRMRLKRKYFRYLLHYQDLKTTPDRKGKKGSRYPSRPEQKIRRNDRYDDQQDEGEELPPVHIWGDDSLAKAFHFQKWRKFLRQTAVWREKELIVADQLDRADMRSVLRHWFLFAKEHRQRNRTIQEKLQRSPLAKYYSPVSNTIVSLASSLTRSPSMSRLFLSPETDARSISLLPPAGTVAPMAARRLSLSLEHPEEKEVPVEDGDDDSFALSRDEPARAHTTIDRKTHSNHNDNNHPDDAAGGDKMDDDSSILFPFDENDSIYLSVSSFSGSHHDDDHSPLLPPAPLPVIEKLLNFSIQKKWQRELSAVMNRNYRKKLLGKVFQAWKVMNVEELFARVYQTYDSDYESNYGSYDSNNN